MIFFVIPAYNEEYNIRSLIMRIATIMNKNYNLYRIIVVNDGSTDGTESTLRDLSKHFPLTVLNCKQNRGLGAALFKGLEKALAFSEANDLIVTMDADETHDPSYVPVMLRVASRGADVVIASRFVRGGAEQGVGLIRKFLSRGASIMLRILFSIPSVKDYTSGYRLFKAHIIKRAFDTYGRSFIEERGFAATPELLIKLYYLGAVMQEVPFVLRYDLKRGKSAINIPVTVARYLRMSMRLYRHKNRSLIQ
jgi:dolichol-phosphate mannosyltransferase